MWAIIGGSGFAQFDGFEHLESLSEDTPFGKTSPGLSRVRVAGVDCLFLPRHGKAHKVLPSEINARANLFALKANGATRCVAFSAVGSLRQEIAPGDLVVPNQYVNNTRGRPATFSGNGFAGHVSLAKPVWSEGVNGLKSLASTQNFPIHFDKTYVCIEGPHFSTQAESQVYRTNGFDIIGMTAFPEYALAREAGLCYLPCCFVTDYDCWDDSVEHVNVQQIIEVMKGNNAKAYSLLQALLNLNPSAADDRRQGALGSNLLTPVEHIGTGQKEWLKVLSS